MPNTIIIDSGYIVATATTPFGDYANADEIEQMLCRQPQAEDGYVYQLRVDNLEWELVKLPQIEEQPNTYTAEQLAEMTATELKAICTELNIPTSMNKSVMIELIMGRQEQAHG